MQYTPFLALAAAFATCCLAQKNAADAVKSIDSITQAIADVEALVNGAPGDDRTETELAILNQYRDLTVMEGDFSNNLSSEIAYKANKEEKEQICASQNKSIDQHILLLDALVAKFDVFSNTFYPVGSALLRQDEKVVDTTAFKMLDLDCKQTNAQDLADKFQTTMEKYDV
ncbi:hypothetical protein Q7P36_004003 [Cladosporium allicinum]